MCCWGWGIRRHSKCKWVGNSGAEAMRTRSAEGRQILSDGFNRETKEKTGLHITYQRPKGWHTASSEGGGRRHVEPVAAEHRLEGLRERRRQAFKKSRARTSYNKKSAKGKKADMAPITESGE